MYFVIHASVKNNGKTSVLQVTVLSPMGNIRWIGLDVGRNALIVD